MKKYKLLIGALCLTMLAMVSVVQGQIFWTETTQEDFKDGTFERNLYASQRGGGNVEFVNRFDLNNDGYIDIFTSESDGPFVSIYWGGSGGYSPGNRTAFSTLGSAACDAADLNLDGHSDFVVPHILGTRRISIYWGSPTGPSPSTPTNLPVPGIPDGVYIADLDKDGYLDIICDNYQNNISSIFWGSAADYTVSNRTDLQVSQGYFNIEAADFNRDGWIDIIFVNHPFSLRIFWGSPTGFSNGNKTDLTAPATPHGLSVADLNDDSFLDLVATGYGNEDQFIFWGSGSGFSDSNRQILNVGYLFGGSAVADIDKDGFLDILFNRSGASVAQEIYWGSSTGYSDTNKTMVGDSLETSGAFIADLNFDGHLDIFAHRWVSSSFSQIYWGPGFSTNTFFPVDMDHHGMFREIGNVYTREYEETYTSSVFDSGVVADWGNINWVDSLPAGSAIAMQVRSGSTPTPDGSWSSWVSLTNGAAIPDSLNAQYLQYQAILSYTNPSNLPFLKEVSIDLILTGISEEPERSDVPKFIHLAQNYPNPFSKLTAISYQLRASNHVSLSIFDITGRLVETLVDQIQEPGIYQLPITNHQLPGSGIYFYRLSSGDFTSTKKLILLR
jgi:hypothetical protein